MSLKIVELAFSPLNKPVREQYLEAKYRKAEQEKEINLQAQEIELKNKFLTVIVAGFLIVVLSLLVSSVLYYIIN